MEIRDILRMLWRRRALVALVTVLTIGAGVALAFTQAKRYRSTVTISITPKFYPRNGAYMAPNDISSLVSTFAVQARSRVNKARAAALLGRLLPGSVETSVEGGSGVLSISGIASTGRDAADTAGAVAHAFVNAEASSNYINAGIVNPAVVPDAPYRPQRALIIGISAVLGLAVGVLLAAAVEHVRRRVATAADVSKITDAPVIARLPRDPKVARVAALEAWRNGSFGPLQEGIRGLRTNLQFLIEQLDEPILITSSRPAAGKST